MNTTTAHSHAPLSDLRPDRAFAALGDERFVPLTTFRRSGVPVSTPVWVARDGDTLIVTTPRASGEFKRLRNSPRVEPGPCSRMGRVDREETPIAGTAEIVTEIDPRRLTGLNRRKYGLEYRIVMAIERLRRSGPSERVILQSESTTAPDGDRRWSAPPADAYGGCGGDARPARGPLVRAGWHIDPTEGAAPVDFVIGMHWRQLWRLVARPWVPLAFARMVLPAAPATLRTRLGVDRAGPVVRQRWRSRAELDAWARDRRHAHVPAWSRFRHEAGATAAWGVWHEVRPV